MRRLLALLALGFGAASPASTPTNSIRDFVASAMPASGAPGLAFAVVDNGRIRSESRGEVQVGTGRKVTPATPFLLGSISKSITALAVMQFVESGTVDLDAGISRYLEIFRNRPSGAITIRQLLSHTSGYSTVQGNDTFTDRTGGADELSRQVERIAQWAPAHGPGRRWEYSNANYLILGALIEKESGQSYARYIETRVLRPIGMTDSFVADGKSHDAMARGHRPWFGTKRPLADGKTDRIMAPAGGVIASARDVARYLAVMMNGEDDVISARGKATMMRPAGAVSPFYGFGWFVDTDKGTVFHSGSTPGNETLATMVPRERKGVVVLVNAGSGIGFGETAGLRNGITARALGLGYAGEESRWQQKAVFIALAVLPVLFLFSVGWAWCHRDALRAKSGPFGVFSLWFPLVTTLAMAWALSCLVPHLFGGTMGTLLLFQPDLALTMIATAATGVMWAVFRLSIACSGKARSPRLAPLTN